VDKPTLVIQYEGLGPTGRRLIAHLAVMEPGAIRGFSYPEHERHERLAHYLCAENTPTYSAWDLLKAEIIQQNREILCPVCFAGMSTA
jgi:hypothetical protein